MSPQLFQHFADTTCANSPFFGLPSWAEYLNKAGRMTFDAATGSCMLNGAFQYNDAVLILLAIIDILTRLAGLVSVGFIIYGGIQYITSQGEPDKTKRALSVIINALIGLGVTILAAAIVAFIGTSLSK
jgi:hypothetical protein